MYEHVIACDHGVRACIMSTSLAWPDPIPHRGERVWDMAIKQLVAQEFN